MDWSDINYFTEAEFACKCGCGQSEMDQEFVEAIDSLRETLGHPIAITSGYRCPDHNESVSSTGRAGPHTTGKAADLKLSYTSAREAMNYIPVWFQGIGLNQKGDPSQRFIHVDNLEPRVWTY